MRSLPCKSGSMPTLPPPSSPTTTRRRASAMVPKARIAPTSSRQLPRLGHPRSAPAPTLRARLSSPPTFSRLPLPLPILRPLSSLTRQFPPLCPHARLASRLHFPPVCLPHSLPLFPPSLPLSPRPPCPPLSGNPPPYSFCAPWLPDGECRGRRTRGGGPQEGRGAGTQGLGEGQDAARFARQALVTVTRDDTRVYLRARERRRARTGRRDAAFM